VIRCSDAASRPRTEHVAKRAVTSSVRSSTSLGSPSYDSGYDVSESSYKTSPTSRGLSLLYIHSTTTTTIIIIIMHL